ncbi:MAG: Bacillopeptidase F [Calditrichaeota bacterium]|nr:Bacillopeptidase F [Calditrichota bacterium]
MKHTLLCFALAVVFVLAFAGIGTAAQPVADKEALLEAIEAYEAGLPLTADQYALLKMEGYSSDDPAYEIDEVGGPDAFGYMYKDSQEPDGPTYEWIDITDTGMSVIADLSDDDTVGPFDIGFNFPYYGTNRSEFWVQSNGVISFFSGYVSLGNQDMPAAGYGAMIGWFWDDLDPAQGMSGADILMENMTIDGQDALVIEFFEMDEYPDGPDVPTMTAEMILFADGTVKLQYMNVDAGWDIGGGTIGIQDDSGTIGLSTLYNGNVPNYPFNELAILYYLPEPDANVSGYVYDEATEAPVAGAEVSFGMGTATTDADGFYSIQGIYSGNNNVVITADGYVTYQTTVMLDPGDNTYDFWIEALPPPQDDHYFTDFEDGPGFFEGDGVWQYGIPTSNPPSAYSGEYAWGTALNGNYGNNQDDWLVTLTSWEIDDETAYLSYYHWVDYEPFWDGYNFKASTDGGDTWFLLTPEGGYPDADVVGLDGEPGFNNNGQSQSWVQITYPLGDYAGQVLWFAFRHGTDGSVTYPGVTIDDFEVYLGDLDPVELTLTPVEGTTIPANGGTFIYDAMIESELPNPVNAQAWTMVDLPTGGSYGPMFVVPVTISPGVTTVLGLQQAVPGFAPEGLYAFHGSLGFYPGLVASTDMFYFWKLGAAAGGVNDWQGTPWDLAGEATATVELPEEYAVEPAYPNPFNPAANVTVELPETSELTVRVFNVSGQEVAELVNGRVEAGRHTFTFDGSSLASGVYFMHTNVPGELDQVQKVTLLK